MAFSSCAFDLHLQSTGMISIITDIVAPPPWLPSPTIATTTIATLSDKVKQLHGDKIGHAGHIK